MLFLSYARNDLTIAQSVRESLESLGVDVWMDVQKISTATSWSETVKAAVIAADQVAIVFSRASVTSRGVWAEYLLAESHSKPVYVLHIDDSALPTRIARYRGTRRVDLRSDPVTIDALRAALAVLCARDSRARHPGADSPWRVPSRPSEVLSFVRDMDQRTSICAAFAGLSLLSTWPVSRVLGAHVAAPSVSVGGSLFVAAILVWTYTRQHVLRRQIGFGLAALGSALPSLLLGVAGIAPLFALFDNPMAIVPLLVTGELDRTTAIAFCSYPVAVLATMMAVGLHVALRARKPVSSSAYIESWLPTTTPGPRDDDTRLRQAEAFLAQAPAGEARARSIERVAVVYHPGDRPFGDALIEGLRSARDVEVRGLLVGQLLKERTERWSSLADAFVIVVSPPLMTRVARVVATVPLDVQTIPVLLQSTFVRRPLDHLQWIDARRDYSSVVGRVVDALEGRDAPLDGRELPRPSGFLTSAAAPFSVKARFGLALLFAAWPCVLSLIVSASYRDTRLAFLCAAYAVVVAAVFFGSYARRRVGVGVVRLTCWVSPLVFFAVWGDRYVELGSRLYGETVASILVIVLASASAVGAQFSFSDRLRPRTLWAPRDLALWNPSRASDPLVVAVLLAVSALFAWLALTVRLG